MALIKKTRAAQVPLVAVFEFNFNDTMLNTSGTATDFEASDAKDVLDLPPGAIVVGGALIVDTAYNTTGAATVSVGDSGSATRYLGATSLKSAARTALVPTGYKNVSGLSTRLTFSLADTAGTQGKARVEIQYIIDGRANENV
jgi:hypothetical protein